MLYKTTASAPQWAINKGIANRGDVEIDYHESKRDADDHAEIMRQNGCSVTVKRVSAHNDTECYVRGWS